MSNDSQQMAVKWHKRLASFKSKDGGKTYVIRGMCSEKLCENGFHGGFWGVFTELSDALRIEELDCVESGRNIIV
jgi:hypothetical protein